MPGKKPEKTPLLERWFLVTPTAGGRKPYLVGTVYNHPRLSDGTMVRTSPVIKMSDTKAITMNTVYELGEKVVQQ